jgi:hypothetical protein
MRLTQRAGLVEQAGQPRNACDASVPASAVCIFCMGHAGPGASLSSLNCSSGGTPLIDMVTGCVRRWMSLDFVYSQRKFGCDLYHLVTASLAVRNHCVMAAKPVRAFALLLISGGFSPSRNLFRADKSGSRVVC